MEYIIGSSKLEIGNALVTLYRLQNLGPKKFRPEISQHCHLYYECHIATAGTYIFNLSNSKVKLSAGEMLVIKPGEYHNAAVVNNGYESVVLSMTVEKGEGHNDAYLQFMQMLANCDFCPIKAPPELAEAVKEFNALDKHTLEELCREKSITARILSLIVHCLENKQPRKNLEHSAQVSDFRKLDFDVALEWLVNGYNVSVAEIAARLNYSEKHITRLIRKRYGMSLKELQKQRRLDTARALLESDEDISVSEISQIAGFGTISNFYRNFRNAEGCTPNEYRQKAQEQKINNENNSQERE